MVLASWAIDASESFEEAEPPVVFPWLDAFVCEDPGLLDIAEELVDEFFIYHHTPPTSITATTNPVIILDIFDILAELLLLMPLLYTLLSGSKNYCSPDFVVIS